MKYVDTNLIIEAYEANNMAKMVEIINDDGCQIINNINKMIRDKSSVGCTNIDIFYGIGDNLDNTHNEYHGLSLSDIRDRVIKFFENRGYTVNIDTINKMLIIDWKDAICKLVYNTGDKNKEN